MEDLERIEFQIKNNKLDELDYDFVVFQLCVLNNKPYNEMKSALDELIKDKKIILKNSPIDPVQLSEEANADLKVSAIDTKNAIEEAHLILNRKDKKANSKKNLYRVEGILQGTSGGYGFLLPDDKTIQDIFVSEKELKGAMNNDRVVVEVKRNGSRRLEGKVIQILQRNTNVIVGKIQLGKKNAYVMPDDVKFGANILVPINKVLGANNGDKVVCKIERYFANKKSPEGVVVEVLGAPDVIETEVLALIRSYELYENFPKNVREEAEKVPTEIKLKDYPNRYNFTNEICFTIDGEDSRDLDDAVSLSINKDGNRVLGVHIADVGEYVKYNNVFDKEAFKRATSVYFPGLVLPMLPRELSNGICSLNENENRLALSVFIEYDENAKVLGFNLYESIIKSAKRFTYTEVQKILENDKETIDKNKKFAKMLQDMNILAKQLFKLRDVNGGIEFKIPEVEITTNDLGKVIDIQKKMQDESHKLIEAFMVAANEVIAEHFCKNRIPFVYRIHETPDGEKMDKFIKYANTLGVVTHVNPNKVTPKDIQTILKDIEGKDCEYAVNKICLRSMQKAKYSPICLGHFGLASTFYCHFTSPIRRYPDLTIHRIIKDYLHGELSGNKLIEIKHFVSASANQSSAREVIADKVERDVDDLYKAFYMKDKILEEYDAVVSGVTSFGCFVALDNTVEGMIDIYDLPGGGYVFEEEHQQLKGATDKFYLGKKVRVKVISVDTQTRRINFTLA